MIKRMDGRLIALLVTGVLLLAACGSAPSGQTGGSQAPAAAQPSGTTTPSDAAAPSSPSPAGSSPSSSTSTITDQAGLIAALRAKGRAVEEGGMVSQPFFDVQGSSLRVQGADAAPVLHQTPDPRVFAVRLPRRRSVIARRKDLLVADDDRPDVAAQAGRAGRHLTGDPHEVLVPTRPRLRHQWARFSSW